MLPPIEAEARISLAPGTLDAETVAASVLASAFRARQLAHEGEWSVFAVGSRTMLRVWGLWGPKSYRRLPLKVRLRVEASEDRTSALRIRLENDEGMYLVRMPLMEPAYRRAYSEIVARLDSTLHNAAASGSNADASKHPELRQRNLE